MEPGNPLLDEYVLSLCKRKRPRVCFIPSASGDADHYVVRFYRHFHSGICEPSHISLFRRDCGPGRVREHLLAQDLVYVGGGSILSLLGVWRAHGIDADLRAAWEAGVIMCGVSAGSLCWFAGGTTDSFGLPLRPVTNGLGFLPYSNSPHHDAEEQRRPAIHRLIGDGTLPEGYATDNGTGLIFEGTSLVDCITEAEGAKTWHIVRRPDGTAGETALPTRLLAQ